MQHFIEFKYWPLLLKASWQAAVIILLVLIAQRALGRRLSPRWRCGLWLLVALRLALPWTIPSSVSLFNILNFSKASEAVVSRQAISQEFDLPFVQPTAPLPAKAPAQPSVPPIAAAPGFRLKLSSLSLVWAAGALALGFYLLIAHFRLWRRVTLCRPLIDDRVMNLLEDCKQRMGLRVPVTVVETAVVDGPCLFGVVRPRLLLPPGFTRRFTQDELRYVFLHELGHVKRYDIPLGWLMAVLQILHWFNPLVWLAFSRMRMDRELACDALALSHAEEGDHKPYGLTIVKLLENFGNSLQAPSMAGIVEDKKQMKERISMIAKFHKTDRGLALTALLLAGLALVTLTDAQTAKNTMPSEPNASKGVWAVRFEPVGDFAPKTPGEFLARIHVYSGQHGEIGYFRTKKQGDKLVGSFLANDPDQLKAALAALPGIKVTFVEKLTQEQLTDYEKSPQESLIDFNHLDASQGVWRKVHRNRTLHLIDFNHLDASQGVWAVRFEPVGDFAPKTPGDFLARIHVYSGQDGEIGYFRTKKQGDKLAGSFLAYDPDKLKAALAALPGIKVTSVEKLTQEQLTDYEKSPQESLTPQDQKLER